MFHVERRFGQCLCSGHPDRRRKSQQVRRPWHGDAGTEASGEAGVGHSARQVTRGAGNLQASGRDEPVLPDPRWVASVFHVGPATLPPGAGEVRRKTPGADPGAFHAGRGMPQACEAGRLTRVREAGGSTREHAGSMWNRLAKAAPAGSPAFGQCRATGYLRRRAGQHADHAVSRRNLSTMSRGTSQTHCGRELNPAPTARLLRLAARSYPLPPGSGRVDLWQAALPSRACARGPTRCVPRGTTPGNKHSCLETHLRTTSTPKPGPLPSPRAASAPERATSPLSVRSQALSRGSLTG